jgi:hypothetical protein
MRGVRDVVLIVPEYIEVSVITHADPQFGHWHGQKTMKFMQGSQGKKGKNGKAEKCMD